MIIVISPAKTLDFDPINLGLSTNPSFLDESKVLISELQEKEPKDIASLMSLSDKLATLNYDRYQNWQGQRQLNSNAKQAMFVFKGDVYKGLEADTFNMAWPKTIQSINHDQFKAHFERKLKPYVIIMNNKQDESYIVREKYKTNEKLKHYMYAGQWIIFSLIGFYLCLFLIRSSFWIKEK